MNFLDSYHYFFDSSFYRYAGNPHQTLIQTPSELSNFVARNNGVHPCFVTLNSFLGNTAVVRTIFNDFDAEFLIKCKKCGLQQKESGTHHCICGNTTEFERESPEIRKEKLFEKIRQSQKLALKYKEFGIDVLPDFTAVKGCHIFPIFKPERVTDSNLITQLFYYFIEQSKSYSFQDFVTDGVKETLKVPFADTVVVSDLRRLCRIPGTKRENGLYCISIPPDEFPYLEPEQILERSKKPVSSVKIPEPKIKMLEFKFSPVDITKFKRNSTSGNGAVDSTYSSLSTDAKWFMKSLIKPYCLKSQLATIEPNQHVRYNAVVWLKLISCSPQIIIDFFSKLGWRDFSWDVTSYQVGNIFYNPHCRFTCKKMVGDGYCDKKHCDYFHGR